MGSPVAASNTETAILDRLLAAGRKDLPAEAARYLLDIDFGPADRDRMNELAAKAQEGKLSQEEAAEVENYRHVSHLLALLQSKARKTLGRAGSPS
jgi:hypothetical protein